MESKTIGSLEEFTRLIRETCTDQSDVLFRGQSGDFPLLPSIARQDLTGELVASELSMIEEFQRHSLPYLRTPPVTLWEWAALAQHHGLPTRLLDWSLNPLAALWFAVHEPAKQKRGGVVWIFRPAEEDFAHEVEKNTFECRRHAVFAPRDVSERITAQVAWFTVHKTPSMRRRKLEPLEKSSEFASKLTKVTLPPDRFADLRFYLNRCGVTSASIFPGLDGLCAQIRWKHCYLGDERGRKK